MGRWVEQGRWRGDRKGKPLNRIKYIAELEAIIFHRRRLRRDCTGRAAHGAAPSCRVEASPHPPTLRRETIEWLISGACLKSIPETT